MKKNCLAGITLCIFLLILVPVSADDVNATANILVSSYPSGATILLNNTNTGLVTPNTLTNVPNGTHIVGLQLTGYDAWSQSVTVSGLDRNVNATLVATVTPNATATTTTTTVTTTTTAVPVANGSISFESSPTNANVYINSVLKGYTPITVYNITPDSYIVTIQKSGYLIYSHRFNVTPGNTTTVSTTLVAEPTDTPSLSATTPQTTVTTAIPTKKSTAKTYTPWPTNTPTPKSPLPLLVSAGALGIALVVLWKK